MLLGHYGVALAAKRSSRRTSLGALFFAAQWLDELWPVLLLVGVEHVRIAPGLMAASGLDFTDYPYSHSLLMAGVWALVIGGGWYALRRSRRAAVVMGALVLSHWFLDLPVHRPDLPLWPGSSTYVGLGLWNSLAATLVLELGIFFGGLLIYARATSPRDRIGRYGLWAMVVTMVAMLLGGTFGPPPPDAATLAWSSLFLWAYIPWAWWVDRHRDVVEPEPEPEAPAVRAAA